MLSVPGVGCEPHDLLSLSVLAALQVYVLTPLCCLSNHGASLIIGVNCVCIHECVSDDVCIQTPCF